MHAPTPQYGPSSDLRIADLPEDLRPEGERLKAEFHALAQTAGLVNVHGAFDPAPLDDVHAVRKMDLEVLRALTDVGAQLQELADPLWQEYRGLPAELQALVPLADFRSKAFVRDATTLGYTPFQWAGVRTLAAESRGRLDVVDFRPDGARGVVLDDDLALYETEPISVLPPYLTVTGGLHIESFALRSLPPGLSVGGHFVLSAPMLERLSDDLILQDDCNLIECRRLRSLPAGLRVPGILLLDRCDVLETLPPDLSVGISLHVDQCHTIKTIPAGLVIPSDLICEECNDLEELAAGIRVGRMIGIVDCPRFRTLPPDLDVKGTLDLAGCVSLETLPPGLVAEELNLTGCTGLTGLPADLTVWGDLILTGCAPEVKAAGKALHADGSVGGNLKL